MERTKDTEPARIAALDLNSCAAEKDKKKARAGVRAAAEGRKAAAKKRAYMATMESSSDDELCDDDMRVGGEAQVRGIKPALVFLLLATAALASGLLGPGPSPKQIRKRMNWDTNLQRMTRSEFSWMFRMDHLHDPRISERVYLCAGYLRRTPTIRLCFYGYAWCDA